MGTQEQLQNIFSSKQSHSAENESLKSTPYLYTSQKLIAYTNILPIILAYLNTLPNTLGFRSKLKRSRQPIRIERKNPKTLSANQNWVSLHRKTPESCQLGWRTLFGSGFKSACYSLSLYMEYPPPLPPPDQLTLILLLRIVKELKKWQQPVTDQFGDSEEFFIEMYFFGQRIEEPIMNSPSLWEQNEFWMVYHWLQRQQVVSSVKLFGTG